MSNFSTVQDHRLHLGTIKTRNDVDDDGDDGYMFVTVNGNADYDDDDDDTRRKGLVIISIVYHR